MIWRFGEGERFRPGLNIGAPHAKWLDGPWRQFVLYVPGLVTIRCWRGAERNVYDVIWRWSA